MTLIGVQEMQIETVSFGEEKPVCTESTESCWSRNRRVEFGIAAGVVQPIAARIELSKIFPAAVLEANPRARVVGMEQRQPLDWREQ